MSLRELGVVGLNENGGSSSCSRNTIVDGNGMWTGWTRGDE